MGDLTGFRSCWMDHSVRTVPAPINASVTLPRVLLKNEPGVAGAAVWPPSLRLRSFGEAGEDEASTCRLAGDNRVSFPSALPAAVSPAAQGAAAAPSARVTLSPTAAVPFINRLTYDLLCFDLTPARNRGARCRRVRPNRLSCSDKLICRQGEPAFFSDERHDSNQRIQSLESCGVGSDSSRRQPSSGLVLPLSPITARRVAPRRRRPLSARSPPASIRAH